MAIDVPGGRGDSMLVLGGIGLFLVWFTLLLRVYVRAYLLRQWGWDDWMMAAAVLSFGAMAAGMFSLADNHFGQPASTLPIPTLVELYKVTIVAEVGYVATSMFFRLCVCCFYLRLTPVVWHIWTIRVLMTLTTLYSVAYSIILLNQCTPISYFWTNFTGTTTGTCLPLHVVLITTYVHNSLSVAADLILSSLPLFILIPALMDWRTKASALALLGLGAIASIGIIIRFIALFTITASNSAVPLSPAVAFWSALEVTVGMAAANMATYRPLVRSFLGKTSLARGSGPDDAGCSPGDGGKDNSVISLSKVRWPVSRRTSRHGGGSGGTGGYILSRDERDEDDDDEEELGAWEREAGMSGGSARTRGSSVGDEVGQQAHVVRAVGSEERLRAG